MHSIVVIATRLIAIRFAIPYENAILGGFGRHQILICCRPAVSELIGTHDFAPFGGATSPNGSTVREVQQANWHQQGKRLTFEVTANAFLYHMVRRMVFVLVSIGQGKLEAGIISQVLQAPQASQCSRD